MTEYHHHMYILVGKDVVREDDVTKWGIWHEDINNRRLKQTLVFDGTIRVSTVFIGIDMGWGFSHANHQPHVFETMVFDDAQGGIALDSYTQRYAEWDDAMIGHEQIVDMLRHHPLIDQEDVLYD